MTVGELFERWEKIRRFGRSWKAEKDRFDHIMRLLGDREATSVDETAWAEYIAARMAEPTRSKQPPSAATLYLELVRAKQLFRWAARARLIALNPLDGVKATAPPRQRETWLTWDQVERLLKASRENPWLYAWVLVSVTTGMRISEALSLRHDRIGGDGVFTIGSAQAKSGKKRINALNGRALDAIADIPRNIQSVYVFWSQSKRTRGAPVHGTTMRRWFRSAVERAGLDCVVAEGDFRLRCHDMRHTCASLLDAAGASIKAISSQLGHAKLTTTQRYLHREETHRAIEMADLMDRRPARRAVHKVAGGSDSFLRVKQDRGLS